MELVLAIAGVLGGIAALFGICAGLAAAWRWRKQRGQSAPPAPPPTPKATTTGLPRLPPRNPDFAGREEQLRSLRDSLVEGGTAALTQAITGLGGVGKTQLAIEYVHRHRDDYEVIWWVRSEEPAQIAEDFGALARALDLPEKGEQDQRVVIQAVRRWLESNDGWLLVFDNAPNIEGLKEYRPGGGRGHVIITSRDPDWAGVAKPLPVEVWAPEESLEFLGKRLGRTDEAAGELAEELGHLPLALAQAAAYIEASGISLEDYLKLYRERREGLWGDQPPPHDYRHTVTTTWDVAMKSLGQEEPAAAELLNLLAFLAPDDIPRDLLAKAIDDPLVLNRAIAALRHYSFISADDDALSLHRLVQAVTRDRLSEQERSKWAAGAVRLLNTAFPFTEDDPATWEKSGRLLPHAFAAAEHAAGAGVRADDAGALLNKAGMYLNLRARYADAKAAGERALAIAERALGPHDRRVGLCSITVGEALRYMGDLATAKKHFKRALAIFEEVYGEEHSLVAVALNDLGMVHQDQGDLEGAKERLERALRIDENAYGPEHPRVAVRVSNLGIALYKIRELEGAKKHFERALAIGEKEYGPEHPSVGIALTNLGSVLREMGDLGGAKDRFERALAIFVKFLGEEHPHTKVVRGKLEALGEGEGA